MSTLKATNLQHASATSPNITLGSDGSVAVGGGNISPQTGFKNRIINGDMRIDQRNAGASVTPTASGYLLDRWTASLSQASKLTFQQSTDTPAGFKNSVKITVASSFSPAAGDFFNIAQVIEGNNIADLEWGTSDATTVTVSFYAKVSVAGSYAVTIWSGNGDRNYTTNVSLTTSWAMYSIVVTGLTSGTVDGGTGAGIRIAFDLGSGSDFQTTAGSWQTGSYDINTSSSTKFVSQSNGATFYITGVQLEKGSVATPFEFRSIGQELALCQRYYETGTCNSGYGVSTSQDIFASRVCFAVVKRATPTVNIGFSYNGVVTGSGTTADTINTQGFTPWVAGVGVGQGGGVIFSTSWNASSEL